MGRFTKGNVKDIKGLPSSSTTDGSIYVEFPYNSATRDMLAAGMKNHSVKERSKILGLAVGPKK